MRFYYCVALSLSLLFLPGCSKEKDKKEEPKEAGPEKAPESLVKHGTNGEVTITIETNLQQTIGLQFTFLQQLRINPEIRAYGRVMDPAGLASIVGDLVTAEAAQKASEAELKRLKILASQSNASERAVQNAEATAAHDQAQVQSVRLRLLSTWGAALTQRKDLPELVQSVASLGTALVELELPASETLSGMPASARLFTLSDETKPIDAQFIGPVTTVDPQMQGRGFLLQVSPNPGLLPGAALTGFLTVPGDPRLGVLLPRSAVVRFNGTTWVYVQTADDTFERRNVALEIPLEDGWFVPARLKANDKVVSVGAQQLLSEELKGQGGGE